jgi:hypothetical protein
MLPPVIYTSIIPVVKNLNARRPKRIQNVAAMMAVENRLQASLVFHQQHELLSFAFSISLRMKSFASLLDWIK